MANFVYIATSLDGFIATEQHGLEWLDRFPNPDNSDYGYAEFIEQIDAIVMGRKTFEVVCRFGDWPYGKPVFVLSHQPLAIGETLKGRVFSLQGSPQQIVEQLNQQGFENLYIDGGATITQFLRQDLIDHLIITRLPILLGKGIALFGELEQILMFELVDNEVYHQTLIKRLFPKWSG